MVTSASNGEEVLFSEELDDRSHHLEYGMVKTNALLWFVTAPFPVEKLRSLVMVAREEEAGHKTAGAAYKIRQYPKTEWHSAEARHE